MTFRNSINPVDLLGKLNQSVEDCICSYVNYRVEDDLMFVVGECGLNSVLVFIDTELEDYEFTK